MSDQHAQPHTLDQFFARRLRDADPAARAHWRLVHAELQAQLDAHPGPYLRFAPGDRRTENGEARDADTWIDTRWHVVVWVPVGEEP